MTDPVKTPADALIYIDFFARFCDDPTLTANMKGVARVIRRLARKVEEQAMQMERSEAKGCHDAK